MTEKETETIKLTTKKIKECISLLNEAIEDQNTLDKELKQARIACSKKENPPQQNPSTSNE